MLPGSMTVVWLVAAALLLAAAALKATDRSGSVVALSGYGIPGRLATARVGGAYRRRGGAGRRHRRGLGAGGIRRRSVCSARS